MTEEEANNEAWAKVADELKYLRWFFSNSDFRPADSDVRYYMNRQYEKEGGVIPEGYEDE